MQSSDANLYDVKDSTERISILKNPMFRHCWLRLGSSERFASGPSLQDFIASSIDANASSQVTSVTSTVPARSRQHVPMPEWLKTPIPVGKDYTQLKKSLRGLELHTVCEEAKCPNISECWSGKENHTATATIMLMGDECTRGCRFCSVKTNRKPKALDPEEPEKASSAVVQWGVDYIVLTSVDRDDLPDHGSRHFAQTVQLLKSKKADILVECLTGDFGGMKECAERVAKSGLDVYAHNIETVEELTPYVRDRRASFKQSISVLRMAKEAVPSLITKSSIMLGFGENDQQVKDAMIQLRDAGVDCLTLGQYMRPTKGHMKVVEYIHPDKFAMWKDVGDSLGFKYTASGPLVRSSYKAGEFFIANILKARQANIKT